MCEAVVLLCLGLGGRVGPSGVFLTRTLVFEGRTCAGFPAGGGNGGAIFAFALAFGVARGGTVRLVS